MAQDAGILSINSICPPATTREIDVMAYIMKPFVSWSDKQCRTRASRLAGARCGAEHGVALHCAA